MTKDPTVTQVHPEIALQISRDLVAGKQQRIDKLERVIATVKETVGGF